MKINHEDTKETKKEQKRPTRVRIFVVDFLRSLHVALRRPETMKKCGAGFQPASHACCGQVGNLPHTFSEEWIMRLWDSALIKVLAVISLIALVSVAQAIIEGL